MQSWQFYETICILSEKRYIQNTRKKCADDLINCLHELAWTWIWLMFSMIQTGHVEPAQLSVYQKKNKHREYYEKYSDEVSWYLIVWSWIWISPTYQIKIKITKLGVILSCQFWKNPTWQRQRLAAINASINPWQTPFRRGTYFSWHLSWHVRSFLRERSYLT